MGGKRQDQTQQNGEKRGCVEIPGCSAPEGIYAASQSDAKGSGCGTPPPHTKAGASCPIWDPRSYTQGTTRLITSIYYKGLWEFSAYCGQDLFSTSLQHWDHTQPRETGGWHGEHQCHSSHM